MAQRVMIDLPKGVEFPHAVEAVWKLNLACKPVPGRTEVISVEGDSVNIRGVQDALAALAPNAAEAPAADANDGGGDGE